MYSENGNTRLSMEEKFDRSACCFSLYFSKKSIVFAVNMLTNGRATFQNYSQF